MRLTKGLLALAIAAALVLPAQAQDPMRGLDLTSPDMTTAEMTRAQVEAALKGAPGGHGADLTGKRLSGLDLSEVGRAVFSRRRILTPHSPIRMVW